MAAASGPGPKPAGALEVLREVRRAGVALPPADRRGLRPCGVRRESAPGSAADGAAAGSSAWASLGQFSLDTRQYPVAAEAYREALRRMPDDAGLRAQLAEALIRSERSVEAIPLLEAALQRLPDEDGQIHIRLGAALRLSGQLDDSARAYAAAIALNPASLEAHVEMARLHIARGDKGRALAAFERAARIGPLPPALLRQIEALEGDSPAP